MHIKRKEIEMHIYEKQYQFNLDSNSSAKIYLQKESQKVYVYKVDSYNLDRFKKNALKQKEFISGQKFKAVNIEIFYKEKSITQKQPFIHGLTGSNLVEKSTTTNRLLLLNCLKEIIEYFKSSSHQSVIYSKPLIKKTDEVLANICQNKFLQKVTIGLSDQLSSLIKSKMEEKYIFPKGPYHGDLTLSNFILDVESECVFLFDFLDSYISSYLLDIAKLKQDLRWGWSVRKSNKENKFKAKIFGESIWRDLNLNQIVSNYKVFDIIDMLNVLRIIPYCKDSETEKWLQNVLKEITDG